MEKGVGGGTGVRKITPTFLLPEPQVGGLNSRLKCPPTPQVSDKVRGGPGQGSRGEP